MGTAKLRQCVEQAGEGLILAITRLTGDSEGLPDEFASLLGDLEAAEHIDDPRPLTGPFVVPASWRDVELGAEGFIIGDLGNDGASRLPLVLASWPVSFDHLKLFATALDEGNSQWRIRTPAQARTRLERLIAIDDLSDRTLVQRVRAYVSKPEVPEKLAYAGAIRRCEQIVDRYEDDFRAGQDFTREQHIRIEQLLQELIMRKGAFKTGAQETERLGLESRLVRLLNAQASRDASGTLQRVLAALTALVLVPTLVAGVFGANVPLPYENEPAMRTAMFALMAGGGVLSYLLLSGVRQSSADRGLTYSWPGDKPRRGRDSTGLARVLFVVLAAVALDVAVEAWLAMLDADNSMEWSTTGLTVLTLSVAVAVCASVLLVREAMQRRWRVLLVLAAGGIAAAAMSALLRSGVPWGLDALATCVL